MFDLSESDRHKLALLEAVARHAPLGFAIIGRDFRYQYANEVLARIAGRSVEDLIGQNARDVVPWLSPELEGIYTRVLDGETVHDHRLDDARLGTSAHGRSFLASHFPVRMDGAIVAIGVVVNENTAQVAAERALRSRHGMYRMLAQTNAAIARCRTRDSLFEALCRIAVEAGGFACAWVGEPRDGLLLPTAQFGVDHGYIADLRIPLDPADPRSQGPTGRAARTGHATVINDFQSAAMTGPWHAAAARAGFGSSAAFPLLERNRVAAVFTIYAEAPGYFTDALVETLSDITPSVSFALDALLDERDRMRLEEQFRQVQKMEAIGQLAGGIAHDFNNLLTVINGNTGLLLEVCPKGDERHEMLREVLEAGDRAAGLTRQLLAFSRRQMLAPKVLDINEVVRHAEKLLKRVIGEHIRLELELAPELRRIKADPSQLEQVILNLAVNARDAMPDGGTLTLATRLCSEVLGPCVELSVTDTGHGMTEDVRQRIFEPFFTTKGQGKGTGLGLPVVFGVVQQSGGRIAVESEVGKGTTFRIRLPCAEAGDLAPEATAAEPLPRGDERLLLVEDDEGVRRLTARMLRGLGYAVIEAADGPSALQAAAAADQPIQLLLTDVVMPGMNGRELAERLVRRMPGLKVLFMSGYPDDAVVRDHVQDASFAFLQKPFDQAMLARRLREVLRTDGR